jgi:uncharacterized protein (DUF1330 family)
MIDEYCAHLRARQNNVRRYRRLLQTELTELERRYIERRLNEEKSAMESLTSAPQQLWFTPFAHQCKFRKTGADENLWKHAILSPAGRWIWSGGLSSMPVMSYVYGTIAFIGMVGIVFVSLVALERALGWSIVVLRRARVQSRSQRGAPGKAGAPAGQMTGQPTVASGTGMGIINIPGNAAMALTAASEQSDKISQKRSPASRRCLPSSNSPRASSLSCWWLSWTFYPAWWPNFRANWALPKKEEIMKTHYTVALAMFAGFGLGAVAVQGLHAQAKPPVYSVAEIDIADQAAYSTYVPKAQAAIKAAGGKILAAGGAITAVEGAPPKSRVVIQQWDNLEKYQGYRSSAAFKDLLPMREKVAKWRTFVVEGVPQ